MLEQKCVRKSFQLWCGWRRRRETAQTNDKKMCFFCISCWTVSWHELRPNKPIIWENNTYYFWLYFFLSSTDHHPAPTFTPPELPKRLHVRGITAGKLFLNKKQKKIHSQTTTATKNITFFHLWPSLPFSFCFEFLCFRFKQQQKNNNNNK